MNHSVSGPVSRGQWSEEETDEEEEKEKMSPESGPLKDKIAEDLQINVDEEELFVLPPAGEMEQDILPVQQGKGWGNVSVSGDYRPWDIMGQILDRFTCPDSRLATSSQAHPRYSGSAA